MDCLIKDDEKGFTIIEMVVSAAIGMLIIGIGLSLFYVQRKSFSIQEQLSEMQQNLRAAMDIMSREIRMAGYGTTATDIFTASDPDTVTFYSDIDDNGSDDEITFSFDQGDHQLTRNTQPVAENIDALSFTYGTDATTGATNTVTITITARTSKKDPALIRAGNDGYRRGTLTSIIDVRNQ
ncbi:MAG: PilW family protein [Candidatus Anammoxibacter sp.]